MDPLWTQYDPLWTPYVPLWTHSSTNYGPSMDPLWTHYGPTLAPTMDPIWTPYGPPMDPLWTPSSTHVQNSKASGQEVLEGPWVHRGSIEGP